MKRILSSLLAILVSASFVATCVLALAPTQVFAATIGTTYFVDSVGGTDTNTGTKENEAWKSLDKVNATTFKPGDKILFKAGSVWEGQLHPLGSGTAEAPIIMDKYGSAVPTEKPIFNGNGKVRDTVYLCDQEYWEINNLEVTNLGKTVAERRAVFIENTGIGAMDHIYIKNLYVHDVNARVDIRRNNEGGIICLVTGVSKNGISEKSKFNDLKIEDNTFYNVDYGAIFIRNNNKNRGSLQDGVGPWVGNTNVIVRNNNLDNIGGDGIVVCESEAPLVEYNVAKECHMRCNDPCAAIWVINCENAVFQYNEAYLTRKDADGQGYDADGLCHNTIFQYNYSHDNEGGFMLICNWYAGHDFNDDGIIRYNISQNDRSKIFHYSGINRNFKVYNNTFYTGPGNNTTFSRGSGSVSGSSVAFYNNIFYNEGTNYSYDNGNTAVTFDNNLYYGNHPANEPFDANKIISDPMLLAPGTGGVGLNSVWGYQLMAGSPCIDAGKSIANNGGKDYFGNAIAQDAKVDIGAHEYSNNTPSADDKFPIGTKWNSETGFSNVSGQNSWSSVHFGNDNIPKITTWLSSDDIEKQGWKSSQWLSDNNIYGRATALYMQCQNGRNPARCFESPVDGVLRLTGNPKKHNLAGANDSGDDGVNVTIKKNSEIVWGPVHIARDNGTGIPHDIKLDVKKGDCIYFMAEQVGVDWYDDIEWAPSVELTAKLLAPPTPPEGAYYVDDVQNDIVYSAGMTKQDYLSSSEAYLKTAHVSTVSGVDGTAGDTAEFSFTGSGIEVISRQSSKNGNMKVSLYNVQNGGSVLVEEQTKSCFGTTDKSYFTAYSKTDLAYGDYKIKLTNMRTATTGNDTEMLLDAFVIHTLNNGTSDLCSVQTSAQNGTISLTMDGSTLVNGAPVRKGKNIQVKLNPFAGFYAKGLIVNDKILPITNGEALIENIQSDIKINAIFTKDMSGQATNIALSKPVSEECQATGDARYKKEHVVDGHTVQDSSGWEAAFLNKSPATLTIDLEKEICINKMICFWNSNSAIAPSKYILQLSTNGIDFTDEITVNKKTLGTTAHTLSTPKNARYVRVKIPITTDGSLTWNSILLHELEVYQDETVDKTELANKISIAETETAKTAIYNAASLLALNNALQNAQLTFQDAKSVKADVIASETELQNALDGLVKIVTSIAQSSTETSINIAPVLPQTVTITFADNTTADKAVVWDTVLPSQYANIGSFTVNGTVSDTSIKAECAVKVTAPAVLEELYPTATSADGKIILNAIIGIAGDSFMYKTTSATDVANKPIVNSSDLTGWTAFTADVEIPSANDIAVFVQVIKVQNSKITAWGEATATPQAIIPNNFTITVVSGTSDKAQAPLAEIITIKAASPATNKLFDKWTSADGVVFDDENAAETTFIMPDKAVTVTATYKDAPIAKYAISITSGTCDKSEAAEGETVTITANAPASGKLFDRWTSANGVVFTNANSASTTFAMPANAVAITAEYKNEPKAKFAITVIDGKSNKSEAAEGETVTITSAAPTSGKQFDKWTSTDVVAFTNVNTEKTMFTMPAKAVTVTATFKNIPVVPTPDPVVPTPDPVVPTPDPVVPTPDPVIIPNPVVNQKPTAKPDKEATKDKKIVVNITSENSKMNKSTINDLIEKNKNSDIVFNQKNVSITFEKGSMNLIDGKEIYDFGVSLNTSVKSENINSLVGDEKVLIVSFNYSGKLPAKAQVEFFVGEKYIGKTMYYNLYNETSETLELIDTSVVDEDGYVSVLQSHCSEYVLTTADVASKPEIKAESKPASESSASVSSMPTVNNEQTSSTGSNGTVIAIIIIAILVLIAGVSLAIYTKSKKH